ncbi:penicillin-binding protein activator [Azotobacter vinelandii]
MCQFAVVQAGRTALAFTSQRRATPAAGRQKANRKKAALLRLTAADQAYRQKDLAQAMRILEQIPLDSLKPAQQIFASTLGAEIALARNNPKVALKNPRPPQHATLGRTAHTATDSHPTHARTCPGSGWTAPERCPRADFHRSPTERIERQRKTTSGSGD